MKLQPRLLAIYSVPVIILLIPVFIFFARVPVLIVSDMAFLQLYGEARAKRESARAALSLFRPVKTVAIADDAGDDIVQFAINEVSSKPHCVLFPYRFVRAARLYRETYPHVSAVILEGRAGLARGARDSQTGEPSDFFVYKTDIEGDFYRVGQAALAFDGEKNGRIIIFAESNMLNQAREAFSKVLEPLETPPQTLFHTSFSQFSEHPDLSCVVISGTGTEFLEKNVDTPVIFFTWLNPDLIPFEVTIVINDAPWVQVVPAVRMVKAGLTEGQILSKMQILSKNIDRKALNKIRKIR